MSKELKKFDQRFKKLSGSMQDKSFTEALQLFDKSIGHCDEEMKALEAECGEARSVADDPEELVGDVNKDLKKRSKKSGSKDDIQDRRDQRAKQWVALAKVAKTAENQPAFRKSYADNSQKTVAALISKDRAKIEKMIGAIHTAYNDAERQLRGTRTTIKKAG